MRNWVEKSVQIPKLQDIVMLRSLRFVDVVGLVSEVRLLS